MFRGHGNYTGRVIGEEQRGAQAACASRPSGQTERQVRRTDRDPALHPGRAEEHRCGIVLPTDHRPNAYRTVRVRYVHQLPANRATPSDDHQQGQDMPLPAVTRTASSIIIAGPDAPHPHLRGTKFCEFAGIQK